MLSIITCTHNPDLSFLKRVFASVEATVAHSRTAVEYIIVDNASNPGIESIDDVREFLCRNRWARVVTENVPGLTNARGAGGHASQGEWLLFFDDDNEPEADYLSNLAPLIAAHPEVACWGPGRVKVEFNGGDVDPWVYSQRSVFQERDIRDVHINRDPCNLDHIPFGTGLALRRETMLSYLREVEAGRYRMVDREGRRLSSGGDLQIVFHALRNGDAVGVSPTLRLRHIVSSRKTRPRYLIKLCIGMCSSFKKAYNEVFDDRPLAFDAYSNVRFLKEIRWAVQAEGDLLGFWDLVRRISYVIVRAENNYLAYPAKVRPWLLRFLLICLA